MSTPRGPLPALIAALLGAAAACADSDGPAGDPGGGAGDPCTASASLPGFCAGGAHQIWDPTTAAGLAADDFYAVADPATPTGLRLALDPADHPGLAATLPDSFEGIFRDLGTLDGWGTQAGIIFQLDAPVDAAALPSGPATAEPASPILVVALEPAGPRRVPVEVKLTDEDRTLILRPMVPLPPKTRVTAALRRDLPLREAGCLAPSLPLQRLLMRASCDPALDAYTERLHAGLTPLLEAGLLTAPEDLGALLTFTTQSVTEDSEAVAATIRAREVALAAPPECTEHERFVHCVGRFTAADFRDADGKVRAQPPTAQRDYEMPVHFWLPRAPGELGPPPYPTIVFGHGLGSGAEQGDDLAEFAAPLGAVTVAIPAVRHPGHPGGSPEGKVLVATEFFGLSAATLAFDPLLLRDNWRGSTWDRLQLVRLLQGAPDVDGDGTADVDPARLVYLGASLGAIMGPELLALTDVFRAAVLVVGGARVTDIILDSPLFSGIIALARPREATDGDVERFFPIAQTLVERGDAGNYAPRVLQNRLPSAANRVPAVLQGMAIGDEIVPNSTNRHLARTLGLPHVPPVLQEVGVIPVAPAPPLRDNGPGGVTAGLFQFDVVDDDGDRVNTRPATHDDLPASEVGVTLWLHFIRSALLEPSAEIVDPYRVLGMK